MAARERRIKAQVRILRALANRISWCQEPEIIGIIDRRMRRWHCAILRPPTQLFPASTMQTTCSCIKSASRGQYELPRGGANELASVKIPD
jgi:hypothetical protein